MSKFTIKDVQLLRSRTGVGIMNCKDALKKASGNIEKAIQILREKGISKAAKKADRVAAEGVVLAKVEDSVGVLLEVNSETDFVAKNKEFCDFVNLVATEILKHDPKNLEELENLKISSCDATEKGGRTIKEVLNDKILAIGENIKIRRFIRMEGDLAFYIHNTGTIGVLVKFDTDLFNKSEFQIYAKDIAMQIAAINPQYLTVQQIPENILTKEKNILKQQVINSGKPESIADKIVVGKLNKFYKECCLLNQQFIKDNNINITEYTEDVAKRLGGKIKILEFVRMERGEGIEKS